MTTIPESYPDAIDWTIDHLANWPADPTEIGLDAARILQLTALKDVAAAARATARQLDDDKKAAFAAYHDAARAMRDYASQSVGIIRGFAKGSENPGAIYNLAQIPAPADRTPAVQPGVPYNFEVKLLQDGSLQLTFDCDNGGEAGVIYEVLRRDGSGQSQPFQFVMNTLERKFTDDTIPPGTAAVTYRIVATRTTGRGNPAIFLVSFGAGNQALVTAAA